MKKIILITLILLSLSPVFAKEKVYKTFDINGIYFERYFYYEKQDFYSSNSEKTKEDKYDENHNLIYKFEGWKEIFYEYDENQRLVSEKTFLTAIDSELSRINYEYNDNLLIYSIETNQYNDNKKETYYTYDKNNNLINKATYNDNKIDVEIYKYNKENQLIQTIFSNGDWEKYEYDTDGKFVKKMLWNASPDPAWYWGSKPVIFTYNSNNMCISAEAEDKSFKRTYKYNEKKQKLYEELSKESGYTYWDKYEYDEKGNLIHQSNNSPSTGEVVHYYFKYDDNNHLLYEYFSSGCAEYGYQESYVVRFYEYTKDKNDPNKIIRTVYSNISDFTFDPRDPV